MAAVSVAAATKSGLIRPVLVFVLNRRGAPVERGFVEGNLRAAVRDSAISAERNQARCGQGSLPASYRRPGTY